MNDKFFENLEQRQLLSASFLDGAAAAALRVGAGTIAIVQQRVEAESDDDHHENENENENESGGQQVATATLQASAVTTASATQYKFNVAYSQSGSQRSIARNQRIIVTGPQGYRQTARLVSSTTPSAGQVTATYSIVPPGGTWNAADNGNYTVTRRSGEEDHRSRQQLGTFNVAIGVTPAPVNQAPTFTAGANQTAKQDAGLQTVANWATNVSASDAGQTVSFATTTNNDAMFATKPAIAANGTLTYTSAAGASGVATVTVQLKDSGGTANGGVDTSAVKTFTINVTPTPVPTPGNQAPSFTAGPNQTAKQDAGLQTVANWATNVSAGPAGEASQSVSFVATTNNDALFATKPAIAANGTLTYTSAAGASGVATVTVQLKDSGGTANGGVDTSAAKTFTINVTPTPVVVNEAPSFTAGPNQTGAQDSGAKTVANWATNISAGPITQPGQTLSFQATTSNDALFAVKPSIATNGTLTYTAAAGVSGVATVTVFLKDSGGIANGGVDTSAAKTFTITVTPAPVVVNQRPTFTVGANQTVAQNGGAKTVAGWATNIVAGPVSEAAQVLSFQATTSNDALFAVKPAIAANGTLTYTLAAGASGVATVTVLLKDSGGLANGGVDTSVAQTFTLTVTPAAPVIPSMVGTYSGTLVIPAVGHNKSATMTITSQTAGGAITGTLVSSNVAMNVIGTVAANGTFTMSMVTPANTAHAGGDIALTTSGTLVAVGKQMVLALNFTLPAVVPGTLTVTRA